MKNLVDPEEKLYSYRCDGALCNPSPHKFDPHFDYANHAINMMYCHRDINIEVRGWSEIISRNGVLHLCPDCTNEISTKLKNRIKEVIIKTKQGANYEIIDDNQASEEIANFIFDLDLYDV